MRPELLRQIISSNSWIVNPVRLSQSVYPLVSPASPASEMVIVFQIIKFSLWLNVIIYSSSQPTLQASKRLAIYAYLRELYQFLLLLSPFSCIFESNYKKTSACKCIVLVWHCSLAVKVYHYLLKICRRDNFRIPNIDFYISACFVNLFFYIVMLQISSIVSFFPDATKPSFREEVCPHVQNAIFFFYIWYSFNFFCHAYIT